MSRKKKAEKPLCFLTFFYDKKFKFNMPAIFIPHRQPAFLAIKIWKLEMAKFVELKQIYIYYEEKIPYAWI